MPDALAAYQRSAILSATPSRLLTMLYDRLLLDLTTAHDALLGGDDATANYRVGHAGEIVAALAGSLKRDVWDGADGLFQLYMYVSSALIRVNIYRDQNLLHECIGLLEPLRQAWHDAADQLAGTATWETGAEGSGSEVMAIA
jgi:flagellar protein FliS